MKSHFHINGWAQRLASRKRFKEIRKWPITVPASFNYALQGPVHTNPFSNENGAVLLRTRLSSTLQRRKRSPKTEPFENALQSGEIWKRCFLKTLFSSVDGENDAIWKRWRHQNHSTVSIQNGGQALPCSFNFAPISRADILKGACVEFIWPCTLRVKQRFQTDTAL